MESTTQPSTRGSHHPQHSYRAEEFLSESSASDHSFAVGNYHGKRKVSYLSTNLVTASNITLADVIVEEVDPRMVSERIMRAVSDCRVARCPFGIVDSRNAFKERKERGVVDSMVSYDHIEELSRAAVDLAQEFENAKRASQNTRLKRNEAVMRHLFSQVIHDHALRPGRAQRLLDE